MKQFLLILCINLAFTCCLKADDVAADKRLVIQPQSPIWNGNTGPGYFDAWIVKDLKTGKEFIMIQIGHSRPTMVEIQ